LRAIRHTSQQPFPALYAATRGYITIKQLNKRSAFLVAAWLIDKHRAARDNRAMMKSEGM
jgi:hypothetical protein